jgi:hypothetical protein
MNSSTLKLMFAAPLTILLDYDLKLCREHGTYVDTETLAFAIHHVLQGDTEELIKHLSAHMKKGE